MGEIEYGVVYVGGFEKITAAFPHKNIFIDFTRGVARTLPESVVNLFAPSKDWFIGEPGILFERFTKGRSILVRRSVALGDTIAVHGAMNGIMSSFPGRYEITLQVDPQYMGLFKHHLAYKDVIPNSALVNRLKIDRFLTFDNVLEWDHVQGGPRNNRTDRALSIFCAGEETMLKEVKPDFALTIPEETKGWVLRNFVEKRVRLDRPIIAVAARAVQKPRNMADGYVKEFTERLVGALDCDVLVVEPEPSQSWEGNHIHRFPRADAVQALALIDAADVACSMDSGAMWLAHCTTPPKPVLVWLGPTPHETKLNRHPLYPDGVRWLAMNEWFDEFHQDGDPKPGCPACYEAAVRCNYTYACVKRPDKERFIAESIKAVRELLEVHRKQTGK